MKNSKFTVSGFSFDPIVGTGKTPNHPQNKVIADASQYLRRQSAAGNTPSLASHASVLQRDPALARAAQELASAHFSALSGGIEAPTATEILKETPGFAKSIGMQDTPTAPKQSISMGKNKKRGMGMSK